MGMGVLLPTVQFGMYKVLSVKKHSWGIQILLSSGAFWNATQNREAYTSIDFCRRCSL